MSKPDYPITSAIRFLREHNILFTAHLYPYVEHGGTSHSAQCLAVDEHQVIKTIVLQDEHKKGLICLMHGDKNISTRNLARLIQAKHIETATPQQAQKWTGYQVGGTSPFGIKTTLPIYVQQSIMMLPEIYINGGKRGFLVCINPQNLNILQPQYIDAMS